MLVTFYGELYVFYYMSAVDSIWILYVVSHDASNALLHHVISSFWITICILFHERNYLVTICFYFMWKRTHFPSRDFIQQEVLNHRDFPEEMSHQISIVFWIIRLSCDIR